MTKPPIPAAENDPDPNIMVLVRAVPRLRRLALCLTASSSAADLIVETLCRQVLDDDEAPGDDRHLFNRLLRVWRAAPLPSGSLPGPAISAAPQPIRASLETAGTFLAACTDDERAALALVCVEGWTYEDGRLVRAVRSRSESKPVGVSERLRKLWIIRSPPSSSATALATSTTMRALRHRSLAGCEILPPTRSTALMSRTRVARAGISPKSQPVPIASTRVTASTSGRGSKTM